MGVQERGRINRFWFVFQFSLFFNLTLFLPPCRTYIGQDRLPFSEVEETHFPLSTFNAFFSHTESRSGLHSYHTFISSSGGRFHEESSLLFRHFTQMVLGFNFFINLRWDKCSLYNVV